MPDNPPAPDGQKPKVKPVTAIIIIAVAAVGGVLYLRYRASKSGGGTAGTTGAGPVTTSYGLGPEWFLSMVKDQHGPPNHLPKRWPPVRDKKPGT